MQPSIWILEFVLECKLLQLECSIARQWYNEYIKRFVRLHLAYANVVEDPTTKKAENRADGCIWCRISVCFRIYDKLDKVEYYGTILTISIVSVLQPHLERTGHLLLTTLTTVLGLASIFGPGKPWR
jgi:hypothetical protein